MHGRQSAPQFVGMTGSYLASIHDLLCDEDPLSDASGTGDNYLIWFMDFKHYLHSNNYHFLVVHELDSLINM